MVRAIGQGVSQHTPSLKLLPRLNKSFCHLRERASEAEAVAMVGRNWRV